jgi:hypothetical protein
MALTEEQILQQINVLTTKTSENTSMVYKTNATLNKGLNPSYFSGNSTKIVNALNDLANKNSINEATTLRVASKVNEILLDIDDSYGSAEWAEAKELMGKNTIIEGIISLLSGEKIAQVLGIDEDAIGKVLSVDTNADGNLILKAVDQIAGGSAEVKVEDILYENRYNADLTNVKQALDYLVNTVANNEFEGGLGGGSIVGEITWDMIDDRPTEIADNLLLTGTHLELKDGDTVISSVPLLANNEVDEIVQSLDEQEQQQ